LPFELVTAMPAGESVAAVGVRGRGGVAPAVGVRGDDPDVLLGLAVLVDDAPGDDDGTSSTSTVRELPSVIVYRVASCSRTVFPL